MTAAPLKNGAAVWAQVQVRAQAQVRVQVQSLGPLDAPAQAVVQQQTPVHHLQQQQHAKLCAQAQQLPLLMLAQPLMPAWGALPRLRQTHATMSRHPQSHRHHDAAQLPSLHAEQWQLGHYVPSCHCHHERRRWRHCAHRHLAG